ncbi:MAG: hypothetical protein ACOYMF_06090 [Bacteroidales bacterium]
MKLRIQEAFTYALEHGIRVYQKDVATTLWSDSSAKTAETNMSNLVTGATKRVELEWIVKICEATGVDANFLFGIKPMKKPVAPMPGRDIDSLQNMLRFAFDKTTELPFCADIISLAKSLEMPETFIQELINDLEYELDK